MLGVGDWDEATNFNARRIRDTLCELEPTTIAEINGAIVSHGQGLHGACRPIVYVPIHS